MEGRCRLINWLEKYTQISGIPNPELDNSKHDKLVWRVENGDEFEFSVGRALSSNRMQGAEIKWYNVVWYSQSIPHHAFHVCSLCSLIFTFESGM